MKPLVFDVVINGQSWRVAIEAGAGPGQFKVAVNGRTSAVDASWIDRDTLSLLDRGASCEVRVHQREEGVLGVAVDGRPFVARVSTTASRRDRLEGEAGVAERRAGVARSKAGLARQDSPYLSKIKAPMPGRVVRVLVGIGDPVHARQPLVVVEAMKMENELRSSGTGTVTEINVQQGQAIDTGAVLLVVQYDAPL